MKSKFILFLMVFILTGCSNSSLLPSTSTTIPPSNMPLSTSTLQDIEYRRSLSAKKKEVYSISVSPNGKMLALSASYGVYIYSLGKKVLLHSFENNLPRFQGVYSQIEWSPDSNYIAVGTLNFGVRIWDIESWSLLTKMGDEESYTYAVFSHPGFAWSPDSNQLILGINATGMSLEEYKKGKLLIWDRGTNSWNPIKDNLDNISGVTWNRENLGEIPEKLSRFDYVVWSPDKKHFYGHFDLGGDVYNSESGEHEFNICCYAEVSWSTDGRYFAATPEDGNEISIWDTQENKLLSKEIQGEFIYALAWTPTGELLVAGLRDEKNVLWNATTKVVIMEIQ